MSHKARPLHVARHPLHVTVRLQPGLPSLRRPATLGLLRRVFRAGSDRFGFRLNHFSVQGNHLHLIAEAEDRHALSRGMQGLLVRLARQLNSRWDRRGSVFLDRYHSRALKTPREVRNALRYVLQNHRKHGHRQSIRSGIAIEMRGPDEYSSGPWFDGWREGLSKLARCLGRCPVVEARTWLQSVGWRRHGLLGVNHAPASG